MGNGVEGRMSRRKEVFLKCWKGQVDHHLYMSFYVHLCSDSKLEINKFPLLSLSYIFVYSNSLSIFFNFSLSF